MYKNARNFDCWYSSYTRSEKTLKSIYAKVSTMIARLPKLQQEDSMARTIQKKLATPNVNVYSGQSGEPWSKVEGVIHYDGKLYIP